MSADNGIYVLKTKGPEYRVTHAQAIDNITFECEKFNSKWNPKIVKDYFGECKVYKTELGAIAYALRLSKEYDILEYGIGQLDYGDLEFPS